MLEHKKGKPEGSGISVETLFLENEKKFKFKQVSDKGNLQKRIVEKDLHRPGLALAGFVEVFPFHRVQLCGNTEMTYLKDLSPKEREGALKKVFSYDIPCIILTDKNKPSPDFLRLANERGVPMFCTPFATTKVIRLLGDYLDEKFAPRISFHGTLVDVYGIGILFTGRSGIGKSEVALDLVARGHRLVADDIVSIVRRTQGILMGMGNETLRYHMEIRGVGIIDIQEVFGIRAIRRQKRIEVQVELVDWDQSEKYERLGLKDMTSKILGEKIPLVRLPIYPGKNISVIAEVIALNQLSKIYGHHSAKRFDARLNRRIKSKLRAIHAYLDHDFE